MKLSKQHLIDIVDLTMLTPEEEGLNIDSGVFALMSDQLDNLIDSIVKQEDKVFTHIDFQQPFEDYIYGNFQIEQQLTERKFNEGDIIKNIALSQAYIALKLMKVFEYFTEIEYYEGCSNINYIKSVFANIERSKEFKKMMDSVKE